ncbi:hypothetical protein [Rhizobium sp. Rhizsp82]|uniref:hypothetical protein n=1 Tax=Rhizobium sp. Rhizsp82 TaxID=3243057 RepID=UPI0039B54A72
MEKLLDILQRDDVLSGLNVGEAVDAVAPAIAFETNAELTGLVAKILRRWDTGIAELELTAGGAIVLSTSDGTVTPVRPGRAGAKVIPLASLLREDTNLAEVYWRTLTSDTVLRRALSIMSPVYERGSGIPPYLFDRVMSYAPLFEKVALKHATITSVLLQQARVKVIQAIESDRRSRQWVHSYWRATQTMSLLAMAASSLEARPWLVELSRQFQWNTWTPTFWLTSERTSWHAIAAAQSAQAFGPDVLGNYLRVLLAAEHPFKVFDALFSISAIAVANPELASNLIQTLDRHQEKHLSLLKTNREYVVGLYANAIWLLKRLRAGEGANVEASRLPGLEILFEDPASLNQRGRLIGFERLLETHRERTAHLGIKPGSDSEDGLHHAVERWFVSTWMRTDGNQPTRLH